MRHFLEEPKIQKKRAFILHRFCYMSYDYISVTKVVLMYK